MYSKVTIFHKDYIHKTHVKEEIHCKGLQGTTGTLQGNQTTGIFDLQGYTMLVIACNFCCPSTGIRREKW